MPIKVDFGVNGMLFAIFNSTYDAWHYKKTNGGYIGCWDGYENSVSLFDTIGL